MKRAFLLGVLFFGAVCRAARGQEAPETATISGIVLDAEGAPVADATVIVYAASKGGGKTATDAEGRYELTGLSVPSEVYVAARKGTEASPPIGPYYLAAGRTDDITLMTGPGATLEGQLVGPTAQALQLSQKVRVTVEAADLPGLVVAEGLTDEESRFRILGSPPGTYDIYAEAEKPEEALPRTKLSRVSVTPGQVLKDLKLAYSKQPLLKISGRVVNRQGEPLDAVVFVLRGNRAMMQTRTDDAGAYTVSGLAAGRYTLEAESSNYAAARVKNVEAGSSKANLVLGGYATLEGQVRDAATDVPLADFATCAVVGDLTLDAVPQGFVEQHDKQGRFALRNVPPGKVTVLVRAPGYAVGREVLPHVPEDGAVKNVIVRLSRGVKVTGTVRDAAGNAVAGARVHAGLVSAVSDERGKYELDSLSEGEHNVSVDHDSLIAWSGRMTARAESPIFDIMLSRGVELRGTVTLGGQPVPDVLVWGQSRSTSTVRETRTDVNGAYALTGLNSGGNEIRIDLRLPGEASRTLVREIMLKEDEPGLWNVDFAPPVEGSLVEGQIEVDGRPPQYAGLTATHALPDGSNESWEVELAEGAYRLEGIPAGKWTLEVYASGLDDVPHEEKAFVETAENVKVERSFRFGKQAPVNGTVKGAAGGVWVHVALLKGDVQFDKLQTAALSRLLKGAAQSAVKPDGSYLFERVEPGTYTVLAWHDPLKEGDPLPYARARIEHVDPEGTTAHLEFPPDKR